VRGKEKNKRRSRAGGRGRGRRRKKKEGEEKEEGEEGKTDLRATGEHSDSEADVGSPSDVANPIGVSLQGVALPAVRVALIAPDSNVVVTTGGGENFFQRSVGGFAFSESDGSGGPADCRHSDFVGRELLGDPRTPVSGFDSQDGNRTVGGTAGQHQTVLVRRPADRIHGESVLCMCVNWLPVVSGNLLPNNDFPVIRATCQDVVIFWMSPTNLPHRSFVSF